jgi:hypothetical protein
LVQFNNTYVRLLSIIIILFASCLLFVPSVFAVQIMLSNIPGSLTTDPFTLTASISAASAGTNYLRVDIYKEGTVNYFGETFNGANWINGSDATQYFPITIVSGQVWSGQLQARVGSPSMLQYDGTGIYKIRLRRYTASGSNNSDEANASAATVAIAFPTLTPIPTETPVPTKTPTPTPVPTLLPTSNPQPTDVPASTIKPVLLITTRPSVLLKQTPTTPIDDTLDAEVLSAAVHASPALTPAKQTKVLSTAIDQTGPAIIALGGVFLLACAILGIYTKIRHGHTT